MALSISTTVLNGTQTIKVEGEVDVSNASELREALDQALAASHTDIKVDVSQMPYIDSTGIGVLVGAAHRAEEVGAHVEVLEPQRNVRRVLDMLGVCHELGLN